MTDAEKEREEILNFLREWNWDGEQGNEQPKEPRWEDPCPVRRALGRFAVTVH